MVRTGQFGRAPRAAPSLTATIVAIARQQQAEQDKDIVSAWQSGGTFEGHKVTDAMILKYWRGRLDGISKDDPLHDTYNQALQQYEYSIAESKMTAWYAKLPKPGAGEDQRMVGFYLGWAKKVPKDSEFYRVLQRDAGQYIRAAAAQTHQATQADIEKAYQKQQQGLYDRHQKASDGLMYFLTQLSEQGAYGTGAYAANQVLGAPQQVMGQTSLFQMGLDDPGNLQALLDKVNHPAPPSATSPKGEPLFTGQDGKPVYASDFLANLQKNDPNFDGHLDFKYMDKLLSDNEVGWQQRAQLAKKTGHTSDYLAATTNQHYIQRDRNILGERGITQKYQDAHNQLIADMQDPTLSPQERLDALTQDRLAIGQIADDPSIANNGHLQSQLRGEATGSLGTVTVAEDFLGTQASFAGPDISKSSVGQVSAYMDTLGKQIDAVNGGTGAVWTQGTWSMDAAGTATFTPKAGGESIGAVNLQSLQQQPGNNGLISMQVTTAGGATTTVWVPQMPVHAVAHSADGTDISMLTGVPVATYVNVWENGQEKTLYHAVDQRTNLPYWTQSPPWGSDLPITRNGSDIQVDLTSRVNGLPAPKDVFQNGSLGNGYYMTGGVAPKTNADGTQTAGTPARLVMDPITAMYSSDPARLHAGFDENSDSYSPTVAALNDTPQDRSILQRLANDPAFQRQVTYDSIIAAGGMVDPLTGQITHTGSPVALYRIMGVNEQQQNTLQNTPGVNLNVNQWWRDTPLQPPANSAIPVATAPLPIQALAASSDNRFSFLTNMFGLGNTIKPADATPQSSTPAINIGQALTVPQAPALNGGQQPPMPPPYTPGKTLNTITKTPPPGGTSTIQTYGTNSQGGPDPYQPDPGHVGTGGT